MSPPNRTLSVNGFSLLFFVFLLFYPSPATGFDLFIDSDYGLNVLKWDHIFSDQPLFFIKDGFPNSEVVSNKFLSLITLTTTDILRLTWTSTENETIEYSWKFNTSDAKIMDIPYLSIPHDGDVPKHDVFNLTFPCTGVVEDIAYGYVILDYSYVEGPSRQVVTGTRVRCEKTAGSTGSLLWVIGAALGAVVVVVVVLLLIVFCARRREKLNLSQLERQITILQEESERRESDRRDSETHYSKMALRRDTVEMRLKLAVQNTKNRNTEMVMKLRENWFETLSDCIVEEDQVRFGEELGKGAFGFVFKGTVTGIGGEPDRKYTVALKTMKDATSVDEMSRFLAEGIVMKDFKHPHVMGLIGVCFPEEQPPVIVLPFMANGDLHGYLRKTRSSVSSLDDAVSIPYLTLLKYIKQIASGMEYLAGQKFVHRDLATRNCMLDENMNVKVGDFGLAKEMHEDLYYRLGTPTKLPVKWMALESLNDQIFTLQTDVWAFGVTAWEILSMGKTPYPGVANYELAEYLMKGLRLQKPEVCSDWMYELMRSCWADGPSKRPPFSEIVLLLDQHSREDINSEDYRNFSPPPKMSRQGSSPMGLGSTCAVSPTQPLDGGYAKLNPDSVFEDKKEEEEEKGGDDDKKDGYSTVMAGGGKPDDDDDEYLKMNAMNKNLNDDEEGYLEVNVMAQNKGEDEEDTEYMRMVLKKDGGNDDDEYLKMELKKNSNLQADESYMEMNVEKARNDVGNGGQGAFVNSPDTEL